MRKRTCQQCGGDMPYETREMTIIYRDRSATVGMPGWYCSCGEVMLNIDDLAIADHALTLLKADVGETLT